MRYQGKALRHELKYAINSLEYNYIKTRLKTIAKKDKNTNEQGEYHIRSLYFDDISNSSYNQKESGIFQRKKYRIRIYNKNDNLILLERKEKYDSYISKTSLPISKELYYKILKNNIDIVDFKNEELLLSFYTELRMNSIRPVVIVDYIREPYIYPIGNVRITFDKNLKAIINTYDIFDKANIAISPKFESTMILEVKYDDYLPELIRNELRMSRHQHMAISKYTLCRELRNNLSWGERII